MGKKARNLNEKEDSKGVKAIKCSDDRIITALLTKPTIKAAAVECGISESKVYSRLRDPDFKKRFDDARMQVLDDATRALQGRVIGAVATMWEVCKDKGNSAQTRLNAADAIIRNSIRMTEQQDVLNKIAELEEWRRNMDDKR